MEPIKDLIDLSKKLSFNAIFLLLVLSFWGGTSNTLFAQRTSTEKKDTSGLKDRWEKIDDKPNLPKDSSKVDSVKKDTVVLHKPLPFHGKIDNVFSSFYQNINKNDYVYDNYASLFEILKKRTTAYPLSLGTYGQFSSFSAFGGNPNDISFSFDGLSINDFQFSSINIQQLPVEFIENIEIFTGSDAVILSDNSSGLYCNIQEPKYNTKTPYTRIFYSQAAYDYLATDAVYSQNFLPNLNLCLGFHRQACSGRFDNSALDAWNVRGLLRWNLSDYTNISLVENFFNHRLGTNGGVDYSNSTDLFDELVANVNYETLYEGLIRHITNVTMTTMLDEDSTSIISGSAFFSYSDYERELSDDLLVNINDTTLLFSNLNRQFGFKMNYEQKLLSGIIINTGGQIQSINLEKSIYNDAYDGLLYSGYIRGKIVLFNKFELSGGTRVAVQKSHSSLNYGVKANYLLSDKSNLSLDLSSSQRLPSPAEGLEIQKENHLLALFIFNYKEENTNFEFNCFARKINSPIVSYPVYSEYSGKIINTISKNEDSRMIIGAGLKTDFRLFDVFKLYSNIQGYYSETNSIADNRYPAVNATFGTSWEYKNNRSLARLGLEFAFLSKFKGETFSPFKRTYFSNSTESAFFTNGLTAYAEAKFGNAFVRLSYENLLSRGSYYVPIYPMFDRSLWFSINWAFLD